MRPSRSILRGIAERGRAIILAASKRARRVREASEFDLRSIVPTLQPPIQPTAAWSWTIPDIVNARDQQSRGVFAQPARLAESMRTDDAIFTARSNRLAPVRTLGVRLDAGKGARAKPIAQEGDALFGPGGISISPGTEADINSCLADHGVAFAYNLWTPRTDGSRVDVEVKSWPIEFVWWNPASRCFLTRVDTSGPEGSPSSLAPTIQDAWGMPAARGAGIVPITHGDGRWLIFSKNAITPFRCDAAILPGALVWCAHAYASRDWAKGSASHGNAKVVGKLPAEFSLQDADGRLTKDAADLLALLQAIASEDAPCGIAPFGSEVSYLTNASGAWEVWKELLENRERAAARIYLGTDGTLGAQGGAPGVDIEQLLGVATTIVQGDLSCLERGFLTGAIEPWAAINFGDSSLAPHRRYQIPDKDAQALSDTLSQRMVAFNADIKSLRENGFAIDGETVEILATEYRLPFVPTLAAVDIAPASTDAPTTPALSRIA